ncbi:hypothetical protein T08_4689 [Trichinella sp. T8]|nr:hypothetical protein T08_4689 [Trichinella sp. T8]
MVRMKRGLKMFKGNITVMMMLMMVVVVLVEKCTQKAAFTVRRHASVCRKFRFVAVAMGGCGLLASKVSTFNQKYLNTSKKKKKMLVQKENNKKKPTNQPTNQRLHSLSHSVWLNIVEMGMGGS